MSVIGPRPGLWNQDILTAERDKYNANDVKPGLTGWAQINGRDELEIPVKAKLDGEYVKKMGLLMDIKCFLAIIYCNSLVLEDVYIYNLWADIFSLAIVLIMLVQYRGKGCFEPIYFITAIYAVMFFVTPIYDILIGDFDWYGYYLFEYGIKTTFMTLAGYFVFYVLYVKSFTFGHNWNYIKKEKRKVVSQKYTVPVIIIMYVVCFAANAYYLLHSGYGSLLYILSLGLLDNSSSSYS